jgi:uracil-DNA glycosylase family 4
MTTEVSDIVHLCEPVDIHKARTYLQHGSGRGAKVLIVGEAPAPRGWRVSGKAFYTPEGQFLPTGKRLNEWLLPLDLTVEICAFTELVKCYIGSRRSLLWACAKKTWPLFVDQIEEIDASLLIILGKMTHETFEKCIGQHIEFGKIQTIKINGRSISYLAIYHPSPISPVSRTKNAEILKEQKRKLTSLLDVPST